MYSIFPAQSSDLIGPRELGEGSRIRLTNLQSAIAVVGIQGSKLVGIHLPRSDSGGQPFDNTTAAEVAVRMGSCRNTLVFGQISEWKRSEANGALSHMLNLLSHPSTEELESGTYEVRLAGAYPKVFRA